MKNLLSFVLGVFYYAHTLLVYFVLSLAYEKLIAVSATLVAMIIFLLTKKFLEKIIFGFYLFLLSFVCLFVIFWLVLIISPLMIFMNTEIDKPSNDCKPTPSSIGILCGG